MLILGGIKMISNVFLNNSKSELISKNYRQYLLKLDALNYLKKENLIDNKHYEKARVQIKKSHIC